MLSFDIEHLDYSSVGGVIETVISRSLVWLPEEVTQTGRLRMPIL